MEMYVRLLYPGLWIAMTTACLCDGFVFLWRLCACVKTVCFSDCCVLCDSSRLVGRKMYRWHQVLVCDWLCIMLQWQVDCAALAAMCV